jgi:predicted aldo/keto reductase-like oxidoreductase
MSQKKTDFSRRDFLKTAGAVGLGSMIAPIDNLTNAKRLYAANEPQLTIVPTRPFGKSGVKVPILALGGGFADSKMLLMKQAVNLGVTYWNTASTYSGGNSEKAIGNYFNKYPKDRSKIFLVTKCEPGLPKSMALSLESSLENMNVSHIDLYLIHSLVNVDWQLTDEVRNWVEKVKSEGKIRYFGFSAHKKMEESLMKAAKLGWIDGIMLSYNFRTMHGDRMKSSVDACTKAGIGLTAMKTQALGGWGAAELIPTDKEQELFNQLNKKGLTIEQGKLKAVWSDSRIACICSYMPNMKILKANAEAAMDRTGITSIDTNLLNQYAQETASHYCAGCSNNCEPTLNIEVPISDVMRYLMYCRGYGEPERARSAFRRIPSKTRNIMASLDYKEAERKCPQGMQIGRLMREAVIELA